MNTAVILFNPPIGRFKGVHTLTNDISPKVNVIVQLEFEFVYLEAAVLHFSHYATETFSPSESREKEKNKSSHKIIVKTLYLK